MQRLIPAVLLFFLSATSGWAEERYLCVAEKGTGFKWDGKSWVTTVFDVATDKFLVQRVPRETVLGVVWNFEVKRLGSDEIFFSCFGPDETNKGDRIICGGLLRGMLIDTKTLRYHELYGLGYIDGQDAEGNTPSLTLGTCSRLK